MTRRQRFTFLGIAAAIAVIAVVILLAAGGSGDDNQASSSGGGPLLTAGKRQTIDAKQGDTVRLRVHADKADEVHIHGYNIEKEIPAGATVPISFKATITGIFEIEFHSNDEQIGSLKVEPR